MVMKLAMWHVAIFFTHNEIKFDTKQIRTFKIFVGAGIELYCGDFFELTAQDLKKVNLVYDRAALIALPIDMRREYVTHLANILPPGTRMLLISMDYDENKMNGPPFSVNEEEVRSLFDKQYSVEIIAQSSGPDIVGNLAQRGLDTLNEKVYLIRLL